MLALKYCKCINHLFLSGMFFVRRSKMKFIRFALVLMCLFVLVNLQAQTVSTFYQPTPLPPAISESNNHVRSGWLGSYYNQTLVRDDKLQVGGWGDQYRTFLKFDIDGLPKNINQAALWLWSYPRGDNSTSTPIAMCKVGSAWDTGVTWNTQPSFPLCWGYYSVSTTNPPWWSLGVTTWYNEWKNSVTVNNGVMLFPQYTDNRFDMFRSTSYSDFASDPYADGKRPVLQLDFIPTVQLKMPFNGNFWALSTEIGGIGCSTVWSGHQANGYFSLDFTPNAINASGNIAYPNPTTADIPILAAGGGRVVTAAAANGSTGPGNWVEILDEASGIKHRYMHMKYLPVVVVNQQVVQGKLLGYMGDTGADPGAKHLDFSVQINGLGDKNQDTLAHVLMEGLLLKSYQVDACVSGNSGRYYSSSNVMR